MFCHERFLDHSLSETWSHLTPSTFTRNWMYVHWFFCGDKSKCIDFRNITNFEIHLLYLVAGLKGLVDVYIFHQPIALSKTGRFQL